MSFESIKSLVLFLLVGISLFLSFILWTYQPSYDQIYDTSYVNEANVGGREILKVDLIRPEHVLFNENENIFGFEKPSDQNLFYEEMMNWTLYGYKETDIESDDLSSNNYVELLFPVNIPSEFLSNMLTFNESAELPNWSFKKMYITLNEDSHTIQIAIHSIDNRKQITATVEKLETYEYILNYFNDPTDLIGYIKIDEDTVKQPIYIPQEALEIQKKTLVVSHIEPELFINALFSNPNVVTPNRKEAYFTDDIRGMSITQDNKGLEFIHPIQSSFERTDLMDVLDLSVNHINDHKGWTNEFLLDDYIATNNEIIFRLHHDGYPLFDYNNLATIHEIWRNQQLNKYNRPLIKLENVLNNQKENLLSGQELKQYIIQDDTYDLTKIDDIKIGYYVQFLYDSHSISLEPNWFILYQDEWQKISTEEMATYSEIGVD